MIFTQVVSPLCFSIIKTQCFSAVRDSSWHYRIFTRAQWNIKELPFQVETLNAPHTDTRPTYLLRGNRPVLRIRLIKYWCLNVSGLNVSGKLVINWLEVRYTIFQEGKRNLISEDVPESVTDIVGYLVTPISAYRRSIWHIVLVFMAWECM